MRPVLRPEAKYEPAFNTILLTNLSTVQGNHLAQNEDINSI